DPRCRVGGGCGHAGQRLRRLRRGRRNKAEQRHDEQELSAAPPRDHTDSRPVVPYSSVHASSNEKRGSFGRTFAGSPWPMLQRKFDLIRPSGKNSASTFLLSKPDIPPTSSPSARAASMKYAPCSVPLRKATVSASVGLAL